MAAPLVPPEVVAHALGRSEVDPDLLTAVQVASALVRSYTRLHVSARADVTAALAGTGSRRLVLGERPVTGVSSLALDGVAVTDYRWTRAGSLWRTAGWGGPEAEVTVVYSAGWAFPPDDLRAVVHTAATRLYVNPAQWEVQREADGTFRQAGPAGFTLAELQVLDRYRRRTW